MCCCDWDDNNYYVQCRLSKGNCKQIAYIPEQFAEKGKILKILGESGWLVESAGRRSFQGQTIDEAVKSQLNVVYQWWKRDKEHRHNVALKDHERRNK